MQKLCEKSSRHEGYRLKAKEGLDTVTLKMYLSGLLGGLKRRRTQCLQLQSNSFRTSPAGYPDPATLQWWDALFGPCLSQVRQCPVTAKLASRLHISHLPIVGQNEGTGTPHKSLALSLQWGESSVQSDVPTGSGTDVSKLRFLCKSSSSQAGSRRKKIKLRSERGSTDLAETDRE